MKTISYLFLISITLQVAFAEISHCGDEKQDIRKRSLKAEVRATKARKALESNAKNKTPRPGDDFKQTLPPGDE